jgi:hypothetical protein
LRRKALQPDEFPLARAILRGETAGAKKMRYRHTDGTLAQFEVSSKPIFADDGQLIGGLMMIRNLEEVD